MKNFIIRTITGIIFVAAVVASFLRPEAMVLLFSIVTGLTVWEFTGLVNQRPDVTVNRFISTVAAVYFFYAWLPSYTSSRRIPFRTGHTPCWHKCTLPYPSRC